MENQKIPIPKEIDLELVYQKFLAQIKITEAEMDETQRVERKRMFFGGLAMLFDLFTDVVAKGSEEDGEQKMNIILDQILGFWEAQQTHPDKLKEEAENKLKNFAHVKMRMCPFDDSELQQKPCVIRDGAMCYSSDEDHVCVGCEKTKTEIDTYLQAMGADTFIHTSHDIEVGEKVHYIPFASAEPHTYQNGVVKSKTSEITIVNVVFKCGGDWPNYKNYTGANTDCADLRKGWV